MLKNRISLTPIFGVNHVGDEDGWRHWQCENNDPQFLLSRKDGGQGWAAGWYRLVIELRGNPEQILSPCLYPDYGEGASESTLIPLWYRKDEQRIDCIIVLLKPAQSLRFDPTVQISEFSLGRVKMSRLTRPGAYGGMIRALCSEVESPRKFGFLDLVGDIWLDIRQGGLKHMVAELKRRYLGAFPDAGLDYSNWIRMFDFSDDKALAARLGGLKERPLISIVVSTYNTPGRWLRRALDSVLAQAYPNWELCISDDASTDAEVARILNEYAGKDGRIRLVFREENGHISESSNSALALAQGEFIALLDHDDELHVEALLCVVEEINKNRGLKLIYSDEDKISEKGVRFDPYFKSDWNYELLLGQNCISHLGVYEAGLLRELGGFRKGLEGSQDWDLALRFSEKVRPEQIAHIPRVLYHWRAIPGSTALGVEEKSYAALAGKKAVQEHLQRVGKKADVSLLAGGYLRTRYFLSEDVPRVSLILPTRDRADLLKVSVSSILERTKYPNFELLIMDNQSKLQETFDYFESLRSDSRVRIVSHDAEFNYSAINNHGIAEADGDVIGLINNDIEVISADWLEEMVGYAIQPDVGAVGAMLYYPNDTIQHAGVVKGLGGIAGHIYSGEPRGSFGYFGKAKLVQAISVVTGACLLVRRSVLEQVQYLDENLAVAFNDVDLCLRIQQAGFRNVWTPYAELYHHESATRGSDNTPEKMNRFLREIEFMRKRYGDSLEKDAFYNPNLSLDRAFSLVFPPRV
ncbi:family 2 glycosyl transferase [Lysobacteraceae bacterium NML08-0793]|nr:family 2 glycosyl transferase [Xanthomonadaceae bacterium NML08-0793]